MFLGSVTLHTDESWVVKEKEGTCKHAGTEQHADANVGAKTDKYESTAPCGKRLLPMTTLLYAVIGIALYSPLRYSIYRHEMKTEQRTSTSFHLHSPLACMWWNKCRFSLLFFSDREKDRSFCCSKSCRCMHCTRDQSKLPTTPIPCICIAGPGRHSCCCYHSVLYRRL